MMHGSAIPAWDPRGVLPAYIGTPTVSDGRSPFKATLPDLVMRFGTTPERLRILDGFLKYRAAIHAAGVGEGFQWINGSFSEDVERIEKRAPNDIDVVTFFVEPSGIVQAKLVTDHPLAFGVDPLVRRSRKDTHFVDAIGISLSSPPLSLVERSCYWYGLWSHRRNDLWKGYVEVDLAPGQDALARQIMDKLIASKP
jgi:hypothetical protein